MPLPASPYQRAAEQSEIRPRAERTVGAELDNIFRLARAERPAAPPPEPQRPPQPDLDAALDMLNRAAQAMDLLQTRYQRVESYARDVADRAERDLTAAHGQAKDWKARAVAGEGIVDDLRTRLALAERRAEQAERRLEIAEDRATAAEQGAQDARDWLEAFYDKIVMAFESRPFAKPD